MRIGVDIDGVLADFNTPFIERVIQVTGEDKFPPRPFDIPMWEYPKHYGYSNRQVSAVWESIKADRNFWFKLPGYLETAQAMSYLARIDLLHDLYFITSRPGINAKAQTERWLDARDLCLPTVLISSEKGECAHALNLDVYIDDRWENCQDVRITSPETKVFMMDRPWNRQYTPTLGTVTRVTSVVGIAD